MDLEFSSVIDMKLAIILWFIGLGIKHLEWKPIKQLSNKLIPILLMILGIGMECVFNGDVTFDNIFVGIVTSMFAVGVHSSGKNFWKGFLNNSLNNVVDVTENSDELIGDDSSNIVIDEPVINDSPDNSVG